jgi:hypothetical protein
MAKFDREDMLVLGLCGVIFICSLGLSILMMIVI